MNYIKLIGGVLVFFLVIAMLPFSIIDPGERGVVTHLGAVQEDVLGEGFHWLLPFVTSVHKISVQITKSEAQADAASKDLQRVHAVFALNWHIDPTKVHLLYQNIGKERDVEEKVISPAVSEVLKSATAKRTAEEVLTKRLELKQEIDNLLIARLSKYYIVVDDISLVNLDFTAQFNKAVEEKQVAEQKAKQAEYEALHAEKKAQAEVNLAKGQAQAQFLIKQTITPELLQKMAIEKWDGKFPQVMTGNSVPFLNIDVKK